MKSTERAMWALLDHAALRPQSCDSDVGGHRLHYLSAGSGTPLLLLHGAGGGGANWYRTMADLAAHHRILAPDLPGFGLSDPLRPRADLGRQAARHFLIWLDRMMGQDPVDVVGTSFGGLVAARMTQLAPDRVRKLVLLDTVGLGRELPTLVRLAALPVLGGWLQRPTRAGTAWLFRTLLVSDADAVPEIEQRALIDYLWTSARGAYRTMASALGLFASFAGQREVLAEHELRSWSHPTLVLWGERDRFVPPEHGRRAAGLMPTAAYLEIAASGHSPNWERPHAFVRHVHDFLTT